MTNPFSDKTFLFVYDRAAVHVRRDFTASGIWTTQTESEDRSEIGDTDMPDLVHVGSLGEVVHSTNRHPTLPEYAARSPQLSPMYT